MIDSSRHIASESEMEAYARTLAPQLRAGDVLTLEGDLGAGKTVLCRALIRALAGDPDLEVPSPTFTLVQIYDTQGGPVWHFDLYRLKDPEEIWELGWEEALAGAIVLIEWPQRLGALLPRTARRLVISDLGNGERRIEDHRKDPAP